MLPYKCSLYLQNSDRHKTIQFSLRSVADGTEKPDNVLISYSGVKADEELWKSILQGIEVVIMYIKDRQSQFRHYYYLEHLVGDNDVVMFIDDDDFYHEKKIEITRHFMNTEKDCKVLRHNHCSFSHMKSGTFISTVKQADKEKSQCLNNLEHWDTDVRGYFFKHFFTLHPRSHYTFEEVLEQYKGQTDMYFMACIGENMLHIPDMLYYHRDLDYKKITNFLSR